MDQEIEEFMSIFYDELINIYKNIKFSSNNSKICPMSRPDPVLVSILCLKNFGSSSYNFKNVILQDLTPFFSFFLHFSIPCLNKGDVIEP